LRRAFYHALQRTSTRTLTFSNSLVTIILLFRKTRKNNIVIRQMKTNMSEIVHLNETDFQNEVLESDLPVLVDFTTILCRPCKMLDPVVKKLGKHWEGQVKIVKLDVDNNQNIAMQYNVMSVPTLILFINGQETHRLVGFQPKKRIIKKLTPFFP